MTQEKKRTPNPEMTVAGLKTANFATISLGDQARFSKTITEEDVKRFAELTGDFNPIHLNQEFAAASPFKKRLVHGAFGASLISAVLGMKLPGPGALYVSQDLKFKKPAFIGDTLTAVATVVEKFTKKKGELKFLRIRTELLNQDDVLITEGEALVLVM